MKKSTVKAVKKLTPVQKVQTVESLLAILKDKDEAILDLQTRVEELEEEQIGILDELNGWSLVRSVDDTEEHCN